MHGFDGIYPSTRDMVIGQVVPKERHVQKESNGSRRCLCVVPKESHDSTLIKELTPKESHDCSFSLT